MSTRLEVDESAKEFIRRCDRAAALGIEHLVAGRSVPWTAQAVAVIAAACQHYS